MNKHYLPFLSILVLLAGSAAAQSAAAPMVKVPDLTSAPRHLVDGIVKLQDKGFAVSVTARESSENLSGTIIDQAPDGFAARPQGSVIRLTVATRGEGNLTLSKEDEKKLSASTAERLRQSFAGGNNQVVVPLVVGRRAIDAVLALQQRGLKINLDVVRMGAELMDNLPVLTVASQQPGPNARVQPGTGVEIKCLGRELDATSEELARLTKENQTEIRHARERLERVRPGDGR